MVSYGENIRQRNHRKKNKHFFIHEKKRAVRILLKWVKWLFLRAPQRKKNMWDVTTASSGRCHSFLVYHNCLGTFDVSCIRNGGVFCIMCCTLFWLLNGYSFSDIVRLFLPFCVCFEKDHSSWTDHRMHGEMDVSSCAIHTQRQLSDAFVQLPAAFILFSIFILKGPDDVYKCSARVLIYVLFPFNVRHLQCVYCNSGMHFLADRAGSSFPYMADIVLFTLELCKTPHFVYCDLTTEWHWVRIKWDCCCLTSLIFCDAHCFKWARMLELETECYH